MNLTNIIAVQLEISIPDKYRVRFRRLNYYFILQRRVVLVHENVTLCIHEVQNFKFIGF